MILTVFKYCLIISVLFLSSPLLSQNENTKWYFGNLAALDFMTNPPTVLVNSAMSVQEGCSSVADAAGSLLFYAGGTTVWNKSHVPMANGTGLQGNISTAQSCVIVKKPGSASIYYVFNLSSNFGTGDLYYSEIDMSLAAGMGSVTVKNVLLSTAHTEHLTSVRHCNGIDVWVFSHGVNSGDFRGFLVTAAGVAAVPVISTIGPFLATSHYIGTMKFSPNGKKLGFMSSGPGFGSSVQTFDFDASTGVLSNSLALISTVLYPYGTEFSPDGSKLYTKGNGMVAQWDLCAGSPTAVAASQYTFASSVANAGSLQLANNGKVYVARLGQQFLGVFNNPNLAGAASNYVDAGQSIAPRASQSGLPNFITAPAKVSSPPYTFTVSNSFGCRTASFTAPPPVSNFTNIGCSTMGYSLTGFQWNFGDPASGPANTSMLPNPSHAFTALGTYTVQLILYYSCGGGTDTLKQVVNVNQPCNTIISSGISCASLGSATITAPGGPFSFTWMPGAQTGSVATGLAPGTYTITILDLSNNSSYTQTATFNSPVTFTGNIANTGSLACYGAATGTAAVTGLSGGSGSQNYVWTDGINTFTAATPAGLSAGSWTVNVADAITGCSFNQTFTITQPPALTLNIQTSPSATCVGATVVLTGTASGGTPGYTYTWTAGPASSTNMVTQAVQGAYAYTLNSTDANNCQGNGTISVNFNDPPPITVSNASICPSETGTLVASGASSYTWQGGTSGSTFTDSPSATQQYTVWGIVGGCTALATGTIVLKPAPSPTVTQGGPVCEGQAIAFGASGGAAYLWNGPLAYMSASQNNTIDPVQLNQGGIYSVTVTAANGCTASASTTLVIYPLPLVSLAPASPSICVNTNSVVLSALGTATLFNWSPAGGLSATNTQTVSAFPGTTTTYTLVGALNSCTAQASIVVTVLQPPSLTVAMSSNSFCAQALSGSPNTITINAGGAQSYTISTPHYLVNSNPSGPVATIGMQPPYQPTGPATATLFGSNGACTVSATAVFTIIPNPTVTVSSPTPIVCAGQSYIYTSAGADSYTWSAASPGNTVYTTGQVVVTSPTVNSIFSVTGGSLGCYSALQSSTLTVQALPQVSITPNPLLICAGVPRLLTAIGTGSATYAWYPSTWLSAGAGASVSANPPGPQSYTVIASVNSCTASAVANVSVMPAPVAAISILKQGVCMNDSMVLRGSGGLSYLWKGPGGFNAVGQTLRFKTTSGTASGIYTLTVTDGNQCPGSTTQSLTVYDLPEGEIRPQIRQGCVPLCTDIAFQPHPRAYSITGISWQINGESASGPVIRSCFKSAGQHLLKCYLTDIHTCTNTSTVLVTVYPKPEADFGFSPELPTENLEPVQFRNESRGAVKFRWEIEELHLSSKELEPVVLFADAGRYPVVLLAENQWGCLDTAIKVIEIAPDIAIYVPNAFTPNEDNRNELFGPVMRGISHFTFSVYDRWGEKVFETSEVQTGWDGSFKGEPCKQDTYIWRLVLAKSNLKGGKPRVMTGHVLLYR